MVPYHAAKARTEPLKLNITQSECLFGVIQAPGESEGGEEEGSRFFSTRYGQPRNTKVVLKQDECLNNRWQTALPGGGMGEPRPPPAAEPQPSDWDASVAPRPTGSPVQGFCLVPVGGKVPTSFPLAFCHRATLGRNPPFPDVFSSHPHTHAVSPTMLYLHLGGCSSHSLPTTAVQISGRRRSWGREHPYPDLSLGRRGASPIFNSEAEHPQSRGIPSPNPAPDESLP